MPDRLVEDPYGAAFVRAVQSPVPCPLQWPAPDEPVSVQQALLLHGTRYIGLRTRFYDDFLQAVLGAGVRQVVLLAAGLDTRAFHLSSPSDTRVCEVDQPQVLAFKDDVLRAGAAEPGCVRVAVGVDLRGDWPQQLREAGFSAEVPTAWLAEGLLAYLPAEAEEQLLQQIEKLSAPGSSLALDRILQLDSTAGEAALEELSTRSGVQMRDMVDTQARRDVAEWLRVHGWSITDETTSVLAARYQRDLRDPFQKTTTPPWLNTSFVTASKPA